MNEPDDDSPRPETPSDGEAAGLPAGGGGVPAGEGGATPAAEGGEIVRSFRSTPEEGAAPSQQRERRAESRGPRDPNRMRPAEPGEDEKLPIEREELMVRFEPRGQIAEQFRSLRNSIHALNPDGASHTLMLASALRGEGKTVACLNLALAMVEMPAVEVLVIDADLHHPAVEGYLGLPRRQGLTEVLRGRLPLDRSIRRTSITGLSVMGAGELPGNSSELIGSDRMRALLNRLKQRYSYVLVDTPQATTISDASLIGAMVDGILLVVRLGETPRHHVEQTYNQLEALGGNILGTCLTGAKLEDTSANYSRRD